MEERDGRALLQAYLPATEPEQPPVRELVTRAKGVRRRRRTVVASAASVVAVLAAAATFGATRDRAAPPPAGPATVARTWEPPAQLPPSTVGVPYPTTETSSTPPQYASCQESNGPDRGASAWATWVRGQLAGKRPQAGPTERIQMCFLDLGYGMVYPPHLMNHTILSLPLAGGPAGTDSLTAVADRWAALPTQYTKPCSEDIITELVRCEQRRLPDGSLLVRRDLFDLLIQGDPNDPNAKRDKQAVRDVSRIFRDGRVVTVGLAFNSPAPWKRSFERHVLSLDQLTAIVTDPAALKYFPRP